MSDVRQQEPPLPRTDACAEKVSRTRSAHPGWIVLRTRRPRRRGLFQARNYAQKQGPGFRTNFHGPYCEDRGISAHRVPHMMGMNPGPCFCAQKSSRRRVACGHGPQEEALLRLQVRGRQIFVAAQPPTSPTAIPVSAKCSTAVSHQTIATGEVIDFEPSALFRAVGSPALGPKLRP